MPELPEVETMVRGLRPALAGRRLRAVRVHDEFLLQGCDRVTFEKRARGRVVASVERRGKWVVLRLDAGLIVIQPRMTGAFWLIEPHRPEHVRLSFLVDGSSGSVRFCDARRLGKIAWYAADADAERAFAASHGPDALAIDVSDLAARLKRTGRAIKPTLLDQKVLAGVGNIYADEILFAARLHPERPANRLRAPEVARLHAAIGDVLRRAIEAEGSSFDAHYHNVLGLEGGFLAENAVYGRAGLPCSACARPIVRERIAGLIGRSTYFCPHCQPPPRRPQKRARVPKASV